MADNTQLSTNTGSGDILATKEVTHGGDTTKLQAVSLMGVSGTEGAYTIADINGDATNGLDVDVTRIVAALPAGTNAIGKLAANSGVDIGDVDVTSCALPTGASTAANQATEIASLAAIEASASVLDDWDETNRCAVNPISGQVGVQGASGVVTALTQRVVLATDVALPAGTNAIGKLAANSGVDIGDVDVASLPATPAGTNLIGKVVAAPDIDAVYSGTTAKTIGFGKLSTASTGNQALVAADASYKIRIHSLQVIATASTNAIYINDGTLDFYGDSTRKIPLDVTGATGAGGLTLPFNPQGWFETGAVNRAININLGSANGIVAVCQYSKV